MNTPPPINTVAPPARIKSEKKRVTHAYTLHLPVKAATQTPPAPRLASAPDDA